MRRSEGLRAASSQFSLQGAPFLILGGSTHYFRVPRAYWQDRLLKMKACGVNTLTTYVPWNLHEPERGVFNFHDQLDLEAYISLAAKLGLWVILRPGPYICAEWDLGGLPSWLLRDKNMRLRTTYPGFIETVNSYFDKLIPIIKPLLFEEGGPIIAVQVENEYGSYARDGAYMVFIKEALLSRGIQELLLTSDNREGLKCGGVEGAIQTINLQTVSFGAIQYLANKQPGKPLMVMEYWTGWFDVWGEPHHIFNADDMVDVVAELLKRGVSLNLYMFHGGTSFGFMNGAVDFGTYKPQVGSYDYDAPLSEAGDYTTKYYLLRKLLSRYHSEELPEVPALQDRAAYKPIVTFKHISLWDSLHITKPYRSVRPVNMENLPVHGGNGQSYGYTLYETTITCGGFLNSLNNVRDRALVYVNRVFVGILDYRTGGLKLHDDRQAGMRTLSLLVENCGRVNYGRALDEQRKGLVGDIVLNSIPLKGFTMYCLDMKPSFMHKLSGDHWSSFPKPCFPGFFQANLVVDGPPKDTFIRLPGWGKGVIFINGENLGRYWSVGPQQFLYLPGPWLKTGNNLIIMFEEHRAGEKILFADHPFHSKVVDVYKHPYCTLM